MKKKLDTRRTVEAANPVIDWKIEFVDTGGSDWGRGMYGHPVIVDHEDEIIYIGSLGSHHWDISETLDLAMGDDTPGITWWNIWPIDSKDADHPKGVQPYKANVPSIREALEQWATENYWGRDSSDITAKSVSESYTSSSATDTPVIWDQAGRYWAAVRFVYYRPTGEVWFSTPEAVHHYDILVDHDIPWIPAQALDDAVLSFVEFAYSEMSSLTPEEHAYVLSEWEKAKNQPYYYDKEEVRGTWPKATHKESDWKYYYDDEEAIERESYGIEPEARPVLVDKVDGRVYIGNKGGFHMGIVKEHNIPMATMTENYWFGRIWDNGAVWIYNDEIPPEEEEKVKERVRSHGSHKKEAAMNIKYINVPEDSNYVPWENNRRPFIWDMTRGVIYVGNPGSHHMPLSQEAKLFNWQGTRSGFIVEQEPESPTWQKSQEQGIHFWDNPPADVAAALEAEFPGLRSDKLSKETVGRIQVIPVNVEGEKDAQQGTAIVFLPNYNLAFYASEEGVHHNELLIDIQPHLEAMSISPFELYDAQLGEKLGQWVYVEGEHRTSGIWTDWEEIADKLGGVFAEPAPIYWTRQYKTATRKIASTVKWHTEEEPNSESYFKCIYDSQEDTIHMWFADGYVGYPWHYQVFMDIVDPDWLMALDVSQMSETDYGEMGGERYTFGYGKYGEVTWTSGDDPTNLTIAAEAELERLSERLSAEDFNIVDMGEPLTEPYGKGAWQNMRVPVIYDPGSRTFYLGTPSEHHFQIVQQMDEGGVWFKGPTHRGWIVKAEYAGRDYDEPKGGGFFWFADSLPEDPDVIAKSNELGGNNGVYVTHGGTFRKVAYTDFFSFVYTPERLYCDGSSFHYDLINEYPELMEIADSDEPQAWGIVSIYDDERATITFQSDYLEAEIWVDEQDFDDPEAFDAEYQRQHDLLEKNFSESRVAGDAAQAIADFTGLPTRALGEDYQPREKTAGFGDWSISLQDGYGDQVTVENGYFGDAMRWLANPETREIVVWNMFDALHYEKIVDLGWAEEEPADREYGQLIAGFINNNTAYDDPAAQVRNVRVVSPYFTSAFPMSPEAREVAELLASQFPAKEAKFKISAIVPDGINHTVIISAFDIKEREEEHYDLPAFIYHRPTGQIWIDDFGGGHSDLVGDYWKEIAQVVGIENPDWENPETYDEVTGEIYGGDFVAGRIWPDELGVWEYGEVTLTPKEEAEILDKYQKQTSANFNVNEIPYNNDPGHNAILYYPNSNQLVIGVDGHHNDLLLDGFEWDTPGEPTFVGDLHLDSIWEDGKARVNRRWWFYPNHENEPEGSVINHPQIKQPPEEVLEWLSERFEIDIQPKIEQPSIYGAYDNDSLDYSYEAGFIYDPYKGLFYHPTDTHADLIYENFGDSWQSELVAGWLFKEKATGSLFAVFYSIEGYGTNSASTQKDALDALSQEFGKPVYESEGEQGMAQWDEEEFQVWSAEKRRKRKYIKKKKPMKKKFLHPQLISDPSLYDMWYQINHAFDPAIDTPAADAIFAEASWRDDPEYFAGFGWVNGKLYANVQHHIAIMAELLEKGMTWDELMAAPQAWGWISTERNPKAIEDKDADPYSLYVSFFSDVGPSVDPKANAAAHKALEEYYGAPIRGANKANDYEDWEGAKNIMEHSPDIIRRGPKYVE